MKYKFTLIYFLLLSIFSVNAQNLTGIWKGYFVQRSFGPYEDRYKFEIQIEQLPDCGINGVTYSYKTTVFYGKADLKGIFNKKTKNLVINETRMVDLKIGDKSEPCLMTCYLDYDKMGKMEILSGTYSSRNLKDGKDCGMGKVFLEKVEETDFYKEEFLLKNNKPTKPSSPSNSPAVTFKPKIKPGAEENLINGSKNNSPKLEKKDSSSNPLIILPPTKDEIVTIPVPKEKFTKPEILKTRENELIKKLPVHSNEIRIDLYDNGEIDGDTISVYHNNQLIVSNKRLTLKPISFTIHVDENDPVHEFVMVAENLGTIPPNTALMVITAGSKRYELSVTSTEQKNAVVIIEFKPEKKQP